MADKLAGGFSRKASMENNSQQVLTAFQQQVKQALMAIGVTAEGYAKENCPVDTGRLRNSITWAVEGAQGAANTNKHKDGPKDAQPEDYAKRGEPEKNTVVIGTNVEYAPAQEFFDMAHKVGRAHFLRDAATMHGDDYKKLAEAALKD